MIDVEFNLRELITRITDKWYEERLRAFVEHPLYNKKADNLQWTYIRKKDSYSKEEMEMLGDDFDYQIEDKEILMEYTFFNFLFRSETTAQYKNIYQQEHSIFYDHWYTYDLSSLETACIGVIKKIMSITTSLQEKHLILMKCQQLVKDLITTQKKNNKFKPIAFDVFLKFFDHSIRHEFGDILWYIDKCVNEKKASIVEIKILNEEDFGEILNLTDGTYNTIIPLEDTKRTVYRKYLYDLYIGKKPERKVVINFVCNREPVYYIITRILRTQNKITLKQICELNIISVGGKKISYDACRKGASNYENTVKNDFLRNSIDSIFNR